MTLISPSTDASGNEHRARTARAVRQPSTLTETVLVECAVDTKGYVVPLIAHPLLGLRQLSHPDVGQWGMAYTSFPWHVDLGAGGVRVFPTGRAEVQALADGRRVHGCMHLVKHPGDEEGGSAGVGGWRVVRGAVGEFPMLQAQGADGSRSSDDAVWALQQRLTRHALADMAIDPLSPIRGAFGAAVMTRLRVEALQQGMAELVVPGRHASEDVRTRYEGMVTHYCRVLGAERRLFDRQVEALSILEPQYRDELCRMGVLSTDAPTRPTRRLEPALRPTAAEVARGPLRAPVVMSLGEYGHAEVEVLREGLIGVRPAALRAREWSQDVSGQVLLARTSSGAWMPQPPTHPPGTIPGGQRLVVAAEPTGSAEEARGMPAPQVETIIPGFTQRATEAVTGWAERDPLAIALRERLVTYALAQSAEQQAGDAFARARRTGAGLEDLNRLRIQRSEQQDAATVAYGRLAAVTRAGVTHPLLRDYRNELGPLATDDVEKILGDAEPAGPTSAGVPTPERTAERTPPEPTVRRRTLRR